MYFLFPDKHLTSGSMRSHCHHTRKEQHPGWVLVCTSNGLLKSRPWSHGPWDTPGSAWKRNKCKSANDVMLCFFSSSHSRLFFFCCSRTTKASVASSERASSNVHLPVVIWCGRKETSATEVLLSSIHYPWPEQLNCPPSFFSSLLLSARIEKQHDAGNEFQDGDNLQNEIAIIHSIFPAVLFFILSFEQIASTFIEPDEGRGRHMILAHILRMRRTFACRATGKYSCIYTHSFASTFWDVFTGLRLSLEI